MERKVAQRISAAAEDGKKNHARQGMKEQLVAYFTAEKWGDLILLVAGIVALGMAIALVATKSMFATRRAEQYVERLRALVT